MPAKPQTNENDANKPRLPNASCTPYVCFYQLYFCACLKPLWSGFLWTNLRYSDVKTCWWKGILLKWLSPCAADPNHVRWAETADTERLKIWEINNMASENRKQCWWWWWSCVKVREGFLKERTWKASCAAVRSPSSLLEFDCLPPCKSKTATL